MGLELEPRTVDCWRLCYHFLLSLSKLDRRRMDPRKKRNRIIVLMLFKIRSLWRIFIPEFFSGQIQRIFLLLSFSTQGFKWWSIWILAWKAWVRIHLLCPSSTRWSQILSGAFTFTHVQILQFIGD